MLGAEFNVESMHLKIEAHSFFLLISSQGMCLDLQEWDSWKIILNKYFEKVHFAGAWLKVFTYMSVKWCRFNKLGLGFVRVQEWIETHGL